MTDKKENFEQVSLKHYKEELQNQINHYTQKMDQVYQDIYQIFYQKLI